MIVKFSLDFPAETGNEPRFAYVYLPEAAEREPERRFPVLYMFDGHNVFFDEDATYGKSWGLGEYLDETGTPLIVAALECNHHPDDGRIREYAPYPFRAPRFSAAPARGEQTMEWFVGVFKPLIDSRFPTLPDREHTFIAGSSMGGLMSLYALAAYNRFFSRAAALSPSIGFGPLKLEALLRSASFAPGTVLYMDMGERELPERLRPLALRQWSAVCRELTRKGVLLTARFVPEGEHNEASWEKQNPFFLSTLMYGLEV